MADALLTTVMPAWNEGDRLAAFLQDWVTIAREHAAPRAHAIVVDDGSGAADAARQREAVERADRELGAAGSPHQVTYLRAEENRGKGAAIRLGWSHAAAETTWLSFIDADGAVPAREYWRVASRLDESGADAVCGSRVKMAGRSVSRSLFRHLQGRTFATLVEELFHLGFYDTQCGMKFFRAARVRPILPALGEDRWLLDVELLARLRAAGATLIEAPIDCHERGGSALVIGLDPLRMMARLVRLRGQLRREGVIPA